jgi:hypothetical protein
LLGEELTMKDGIGALVIIFACLSYELNLYKKFEKMLKIKEVL